MSITQLSITNLESLSRVLIFFFFFFLFYFRSQAAVTKKRRKNYPIQAINPPHNRPRFPPLPQLRPPSLSHAWSKRLVFIRICLYLEPDSPPICHQITCFRPQPPPPPLEDVENDVSSPSVAIPPGGHHSIDSADTEFTMTVWSTHADGKCEVDVENFGDRLVLLSRLVHEGNQFASVQRLM